MENEKKFCPNCGAKLENGAVFCGSCGIKLEASAPEKPEADISQTNEGTPENTGNTGTAADAEPKIGQESTPAESSPLEEQAQTSEKIPATPAIEGKAPEAGSQAIPVIPAPKEKKAVNKKLFGILGAVVVILAIAAGIFAYVNSLPKSILADAKVVFTGYNHQGTVYIKDNAWWKKEDEIVGKKAGFNADEIKAIENGKGDSLKETYPDKWSNFEKYLDDIKIKFSKSYDLSNGEKITLSVTTSLKDNPVKAEKKTYTVEGLKKSTLYKVETVLKEYPIKVTGFNHFGSLSYDDKVWTLPSDDENSELANGTSVTLRLSDSYIEKEKEKGRILSGDDSTTVDISGLADSPTISNLSELLAQEDTLARSHNKTTTDDFGTTYTITRQATYFIGKDINSYSSDDSNGGFSIVTIYKIVSHNNDDKDDHSNDDTNYIIYGYGNLSLNGNKIDVSALSESDQYSGYSNDTQQACVDDLKSDYPGAVQLQVK